MISWQIADPAQVLDGLLALALGQEPAWRLLEPDRAEEQETTWDQLNLSSELVVAVLDR